ncbi:MAG: flavin reductase family protein [Paracoccus sp. (in: a-proteobacteria)]|uniref:flavin reductase family protein n=1 Tax=Paracoccus sp. TaxID=267 RepID=UPI0026DEDE16|nr:flavin reductase family protein [Paracoccus sp. (in: a-proteobacteria)]MDO5611944.1 flavin reductase family protein [Paracoccus sp. (in: a-proteobacteria)]
MTEFDFTALPADDRYRLLTNFVGPRPIALVSTSGPAGRNAAPMSFFNVFSHEPPIVILGIQTRPDGASKDTVANIRATGEFVVNMVDMALAPAMLVCGLPFDADVDEILTAGLTPRPGARVRAPIITEAPCAMECRVEQLIDYDRRVIVLGLVEFMHVRRDCLDDGGRYVDPAAYQPIARLHADEYIVPDRQFTLRAPPIDSIIPIREDAP